MLSLSLLLTPHAVFFPRPPLLLLALPLLLFALLFLLTSLTLLLLLPCFQFQHLSFFFFALSGFLSSLSQLGLEQGGFCICLSLRLLCCKRFYLCTLSLCCLCLLLLPLFRLLDFPRLIARHYVAALQLALLNDVAITNFCTIKILCCMRHSASLFEDDMSYPMARSVRKPGGCDSAIWHQDTTQLLLTPTVWEARHHQA
mmetsp:Transcript_13148/g.29941  ORF Transcript_13148/g.29941 Transcript_13148/m.29941 type:complete len:200 (-) Transcript_13148:455-1054(-)